MAIGSRTFYLAQRVPACEHAKNLLYLAENSCMLVILYTHMHCDARIHGRSYAMLPGYDAMLAI